jgi:hypothetical protein
LMPLSPVGLRGAESWHMGQPQPLIDSELTPCSRNTKL